jgi:hypothetical protein
MIQGRNNMQMIDVLKKLAELDEATSPKPMVQMANDPTVAVITESITGEAGMPVAAPTTAPTVPASFSINASAANGNEVSTMLRDILNLAGVKEVGAHDINQPEHPQALTAEPGQDGDDIKQALDAIGNIEDEDMGGMDPSQMGGEPPMDMGDPNAEMGTAGPAGGTDVAAMADEVNDMADRLAGTSKEELGLESLRHFDNSPQEAVKDYNPNDFANIINKVRQFDYTSTPANNNLPESREQQYVPAEEEGNLLDMTQRLYQEYQGFIKNI